MPGVPKHKEAMQFWSARGFWTFFPRYRGTWESDGEFLKHSPEKDVLDIIDALPKGFSDLWSEKEFKITSPKIFIIGGSFGGPAAILASRDKRVIKAVGISPVIDWRADAPDEPMDKLGRHIPKAFGQTYRFSPKNWARLSRGEFYNPIDEMGTIDGSKLLLFHAKDDRVVPFGPTKKFVKQTGANLITFPRGGHFGSSDSLLAKFSKPIQAFFSKK